MTLGSELNAGTEDATPDALYTLIPEFLGYLAAGDPKAAAALWDVPALILGDNHVHGPLSSGRLEALFADTVPSARQPDDALHPVRAMQLAHRIDQVEWVAGRVATIEARWPPAGFRGFLEGIGSATFLVRLDELGQPKLRGLLLRDG